ncbi:MAG: FAD-dependent oxidoreductase [Clostridia bacterium]|nr:FAD-dependent oxidoreductase [Clostridia bacterium]
MLYSRTLDVRYTPDVLVVGGGAAGTAAAIAAARMGRDVLLCESGGCFGGVGTTGLVPSYAAFSDGETMLCSGIGLEIRRAACPGVSDTQTWTSIEPELLKRVYDDAVTEAGVKFLFFTKLCDVVTAGQRIVTCVFTSAEGMFAVQPKIVIDCTGDGEVIALAGGKFELGDDNGDVMPSTLCSQWTGVNYDEYRKANVTEALEKAIADGVFTYEDRHLTGLNLRANGICGGNIGHVFGFKACNNRSLTDAMVWGRKSLLEYQAFYRKYVRGCENITLTGTANMLGIRESRRILCDHMLSVKDFIARRDFEDEIGRYCYPIDIHVMNTSAEEMERFNREYRGMKYGKGESYGIPLRSLIPVSFTNALTAGRCMGTDRQMEASVRVMPGCYITGQAAGTAAAMAVLSGDVRSVRAADLQKVLYKEGAYMRKELR